MQRREFLTYGAFAAGGTLLATRVAFARAATSRSRFVLVIMRGARECHARGEQRPAGCECAAGQEFTSLHRLGSRARSAPHELG